MSVRTTAARLEGAVSHWKYITTLHVLQVYYEDLDDGDRVEAYCNLVHCYSLPGDAGLWVEHGYFDDRYY